MTSLSNYGENALMGHLFGSSYTAPATVYLALATADPGEAATGASMNEVANSGGYARKAITFGAASAKRVTQNATVTFDQATGNWGTVTHWAILDSATYGAGNVLAYGALVASKSVVTGNTPSVASGQTYVEITGNVGVTTANSLLDLMFRNQAYSQPATYVALCTVAVTDTMTGSTITEPSGNNYARTLVNKAGGASPAWNAVSGGATTNANDITAPTPSGSWGTVVGMALISASSAGNLLVFDNTNVVDQAVGSGDTVVFQSGQAAFSLS